MKKSILVKFAISNSRGGIQMTDAGAFALQYARRERIINEREDEIDFLESRPMALQAPCLVEGFGLVMCRADNEGRLYDPSEWKDGEVLLFDLAAAVTEIADCKRRISRYKTDGFSIDIDIDNRIDKAAEELKSAQRINDAEEKNCRANHALGIALYVSEEIELSVAQQKLQNLASPRAFSFGTFVDWNLKSYPSPHAPDEYNEKYRAIFNSAAVTMLWKLTQPSGPQGFDWKKMDEQFGFIERNKLEGIGHCLGWLNYIPAWVKQLSSTPELINYLLHLTDATVERYGHLVRLWSACNEFHDHGREYELDIKDRVTVFSTVNRHLRKIHPSSAVESDSCSIMGRPSLQPRIDPWEWYEKIIKSGNNGFTIGLQMYYGMLSTYDLGRITRQLESYCKFGLPLHLYVSVPGGVNHPCLAEGNTVYGIWHNDWSEETQAEWWEQFLTIVLSIPQVRGVTTISLHDTNEAWLGYDGFCRPDLTPKPVFERVKKLIEKHTDRSAQVSWTSSFNPGKLANG